MPIIDLSYPDEKFPAFAAILFIWCVEYIYRLTRNFSDFGIISEALQLAKIVYH